MSTIQVTPDFIKKYTVDKYRHDNYKQSIDIYDSMLVHADGLFPEKLVSDRRPSESKVLFEYRKKIFESQTIQCFSKIMNSLSKIRKSQDWSIKYDTETCPCIVDGEKLEDYCEKDFPYFGSVTNWFFKLAFKQYIVDPNAIIAIYPLTIPVDNEYVKPYPVVYNSNLIWDWVDGDYTVLQSIEKNVFVENGVEYEGMIFYTITTEDIWISKQINTKEDYITELYYKHNLGELPCVKMKGDFFAQDEEYTLYKSKLHACLPSWNEAVREYSDMQASVCKHMFPTMVIHTNSKCTSCNGVGKVLQKEGKGLIECESCHGKGGIPTSPYEDIEIRPSMANEQPLPTPVAYYIDKNTDIIKIQDERIQNHILRGFSAVNFEFLAVGLNQSGVAKELDRSELNAFIYDISEDIVSILDEIYSIINDYRYSVILPNDEQRDAQLPKINVPERYDIISETYLADEIAKAKTNKVNPFIVNALEIEYANKKFNTSPDIRDRVRLSLELDPLAGLTEDEKLVKRDNGGITKTDYIISSYIVNFIRRAIDENPDFVKLNYKTQMDILNKYADEVQSKNDLNVVAMVVPPKPVREVGINTPQPTPQPPTQPNVNG